MADVFGRWDLLTPRLAEMERLWFSTARRTPEGVARMDACWAEVERFLEATREDTASRATARSLAAWPRYMSAGWEEGSAWARGAIGIDPEVPFPQFMLALLFVSETVNTQPLPSLNYAPTGLAFSQPPPESSADVRIRDELERLLADAETCPVWGREGAVALRSTLGGFISFQRGEYEAADRAFTLAIASPDLRSLRNALLSARSRARFYRMAFAESVEDMEAVRSARPESAAVHASLGDAHTAIGFQQSLAGRDPREAYRLAISMFDTAERLQPDLELLHTHRGHAWHRLAQAEAHRGGSEGEMVDRACADYEAEIVPRGGSWYEARCNRGHLLRWWGEHLAREGRDPSLAFDRAISDFTELLREDPRDVDALSGRATAHARRGEALSRTGEDPRPDWERALPDFERAIEVDAGHLLSLLGRARLQVLLAELESARGIDPLQRHLSAEADLRKSLERCPEWVEAMQSLACLCEERARREIARGEDPRAHIDEATLLLDRALEVRPGDPEMLLDRSRVRSMVAERAAQRGEDAGAAFDLALSDLDALVEANPRHPTARINRANNWIRRAAWERSRGADARKSLDRATADYDEAVKRRPADPSIHSGRAAARLRMAEDCLARGLDATEWIDGAIEDLDEALARKGRDVDVLLNRGAAWFFRGQALATGGKDPRESFRKAIADFDAVLERDPSDLDARVNRAASTAALAANEAVAGADARPLYLRAVEDLTHVLSKSPDAWELWMDLGAASEGAGEIERAVEAYERALRIAGESAPGLKARLDAARAKLPR